MVESDKAAIVATAVPLREFTGDMGDLGLIFRPLN